VHKDRYGWPSHTSSFSTKQLGILRRRRLRFLLVLTAGLLDDASDVGAPAIKRFFALSQEFVPLHGRYTGNRARLVVENFIGDMRPAAASAYGASAPGKLSNDAISGAPISRTASAATSC
jgi:hypothetical protein